MSEPAFFLTGTGTGVGKTVAGCVIAARWAASGKRPRVMKPAESGCAPEAGRLVPRDALALRTASSDARPLAEICPYRYRAPLAPAHAAEREGAPPDVDRLAASITALKKEGGPLLVEGAGGLLAPLAAGVFMGDLARLAGLPLLIVAPLGLGAVNHTLLTAREAKREGLEIAGVLLCDVDGEATPAAARNPAAIRELCGEDAPLLGVIPHLAGVDDLLPRTAPGSEAAERLLSLARGLRLDAPG